MMANPTMTTASGPVGKWLKHSTTPRSPEFEFELIREVNHLSIEGQYLMYSAAYIGTFDQSNRCAADRFPTATRQIGCNIKPWCICLVWFVFSVACWTGSRCDSQEIDGKPFIQVKGIIRDEAENPIEGATIETLEIRPNAKKLSTKSVKGGGFLLNFPSDVYYGRPIVIHDESKQLASYISGFQYTAASRNIFRVTLKPVRQTVVAVVDQAGNPQPDATVHLLVDYASYQSGTTDAEGKFQFTYPGDAPINWIVAYKDGAGLDYYENNTSFLMNGRSEIPNQISLTLTGVQRVRVKVVDSMRRPVADVHVTPWLIHKQGKRDYVNLSGLLLGKSDEDGVAELRFIPQQCVGQVAFLISDEKYHCPIQPTASEDQFGKDAIEMGAVVYQLVRVSGKVVHADGTPAAGIRLQGEGRGGTNMYYRGHTSTNADGTYEMNVYPDQSTLIAITDERQAAESHNFPGMKEGSVLENQDFQLSDGALISGVMTFGAERRPVVNGTATLVQIGDRGGELVRWSQTDKDGRYQFRVGPGKYRLRLGDDKQISVDVDNEDLLFNCHVDRLPRGPLSGKVTDEMGRPASNAFIVGESINAASHAGFRLQCDPDGEFETEKWNDRLRLVIVCDERKLFGICELPPDAETIALSVQPAATLEGTIVDARGLPVAGCRVAARMRNPIEKVVIQGQTDANGKFVFPAVGRGIKWFISAEPKDRPFRTIEFEASEAKPYTIPNIVIEDPQTEEPTK